MTSVTQKPAKDVFVHRPNTNLTLTLMSRDVMRIPKCMYLYIYMNML